MNLRAVCEFISGDNMVRRVDQIPRWEGSEASDALLDWVRTQLADHGVDILDDDEVHALQDIVSFAMFAQRESDETMWSGMFKGPKRQALAAAQ